MEIRVIPSIDRELDQLEAELDATTSLTVGPHMAQVRKLLHSSYPLTLSEYTRLVDAAYTIGCNDWASDLHA